MRVRGRRGASATSYGLLLGLISIFALTSLQDTSDAIAELFCEVSQAMERSGIGCFPQGPVFAVSSIDVNPVEGFDFQLQIIYDYPGITMRYVGDLPTGMSFDPGTGVLSGTPTNAETESVTFEATNADGATAALALAIQVERNQPPSLANLPAGPIAVPANQPIAIPLEANDPNELNQDFEYSVASPAAAAAGFAAVAGSGRGTGVLQNPSPDPGTYFVTVCVSDLRLETCNDLEIVVGINGPRLTVLGANPRRVDYDSSLQTQVCEEIAVRNDGAGTAIGVQPRAFFGGDPQSFETCTLDSPTNTLCGAGVDLASGERCSVGVAFTPPRENPQAEAQLGRPLGINREHAAVLPIYASNGGNFVTVRGFPRFDSCSALLEDTEFGPGSYSFTVPTGCESLDVEIWGGGGGLSYTGSPPPNHTCYQSGGGSGFVQASIPVTQGQTVLLLVGNPGRSEQHGLQNGGTSSISVDGTIYAQATGGRASTANCSVSGRGAGGVGSITGAGMAAGVMGETANGERYVQTGTVRRPQPGGVTIPSAGFQIPAETWDGNAGLGAHSTLAPAPGRITLFQLTD